MLEDNAVPHRVSKPRGKFAIASAGNFITGRRTWKKRLLPRPRPRPRPRTPPGPASCCCFLILKIPHPVLKTKWLPAMPACRCKINIKKPGKKCPLDHDLSRSERLPWQKISPAIINILNSTTVHSAKQIFYSHE